MSVYAPASILNLMRGAGLIIGWILARVIDFKREVYTQALNELVRYYPDTAKFVMHKGKSLSIKTI